MTRPPTAFLLTISLLSAGLSAQEAKPFDPAEWFDARITGTSTNDVVLLTEMGVDVQNRMGSELLVYVTLERVQELEAMGYDVTRLPRVGPDAGNGPEASAYPSFPELSQGLQAVAAAYPDICQLYDIGSTVQGRTLWFLKISDNVGVEEDEPEFKYISTMHGDEVVGMELCRNLITLLTTQYGVDPRITRLVDEVEIWIMPLMNPDGYVAGGRYNAQGIDLNRRFPDRVNNPVNSPAGRPPEVQALMNWGYAHSPVLSANMHGGALVANYPYDSDANPFSNYSAAPDDALFISQSLAYSAAMPRMFNSGSFNQGITNGVEWYLVYGGMQDWNYVWQGCNDITLEMDNSKWPSYSRIPGLWNEHRESMLTYMEQCLMGVRGRVTDIGTGAALSATIEALGIDHIVRTDPDVGDYHRMLLPGTYSMRVSSAGYVPQSLSGVGVGSGDALVLDVPMTPEGFTAPNPQILIDGQSGSLSVSSSQAIQMTVSMDPGDLAGVALDWWVFGTNVSAGGTTYWWTPGKVYSTPTRVYGGPLVPLNNYTISMGMIPSGTWTFTFGVDVKDNTYQGSFIDSISVTSN